MRRVHALLSSGAVSLLIPEPAFGRDGSGWGLFGLASPQPTGSAFEEARAEPRVTPACKAAGPSALAGERPFLVTLSLAVKQDPVKTNVWAGPSSGLSKGPHPHEPGTTPTHRPPGSRGGRIDLLSAR